MPVVVKKKKKIKRGLGSRAGVSSREQSPYRPHHVERLAPCMDGCPQGTNIRGALVEVQLAEKHEKSYDKAFEDAWHIWTETNPMPAVLGRVCPHPCESACNRKEKDGAVSINAFERFLGDFALEKGFQFTRENDETYSEKVAIIGAGPAGLTCAYHLARKGYKPTIFESMPKPGGMLRYGIPAYRLSRKVLDAEINRILALGVDLKCDTAVGKDVSLEDLRKEYDAIFVGIGAWKGLVLHIDGEDAENVFNGIDFLARANEGEKVDIGDKVLVVGGGDTAIDAARMSKRMGAEVTVVYRRTRNEMPAIEEEIEGALEEGINIDYLVAPVKIVKDGNKAVKMVCQRMELGEPDESGRRRPVPIENSEFEMDCTAVIAAISQNPKLDGLDELSDNGRWIGADKETYATKLENVFVGGDAFELGLVTIANAQGRKAADILHYRFRGLDIPANGKMEIISHEKILLHWYEDKPRNEREMAPVAERFSDPEKEIQQGLSTDQAIDEAKRCMSCGLCFECGNCWSYCQDNAVIKPLLPGEKYAFKLEFCTGCKKCSENCPCGYIEMQLK